MFKNEIDENEAKDTGNVTVAKFYKRDYDSMKMMSFCRCSYNSAHSRAF